MATKYATMPKAWSNKRKAERLRADAFASLTRMLSRAVAETGTNFSIYSALRTNSEQRALFVKNYRRRGGRKGASTDRFFEGAWWRRVGVSVAVPGSKRSNHESGRSIDIHPGAIQEWIKRNGLRFGWNWEAGRRQNENWHFEYRARGDRYKSEGLLDHAAIQKAVGAEVDGKIGTGTVAKIKAFQKKHGLEVDGKVGPATKKALFSGKGEAAPESSVPATSGGGTSTPAPQPVPTELKVEQAGPARNAYAARTYDGVDYEIKHVTIHWWGKPSGQTFEGIRDYLIDNDRQVSAHYVLSGPRAAQILPEERGAWGNGNRRANLEGIVVECDPNRVEETIPTLVALLADIFKRRGPLDVFPHDHWTSTECLGDYRPHLPAIVEAARSGESLVVSTPAPAPSSPKPTTGGGLPTGKDLLMKLADVPDFPLLRTPGNLCYYGSPDGPIESVSGKNTNSLHPGEIETVGGKTRSKGLMTLQRQLVVRGYAVDIDGRWGAQMDNAIDNLQRLAGLVRDKKVGPVTWYAAWLLPVK